MFFRILVSFLNKTVCLYCSYSVCNGGYIGFKNAVPVPDPIPRIALCIFYEGRNRKLSNEMHVVIYQNVGFREYYQNILSYCRQNVCICRYWGHKGPIKHTIFLHFFCHLSPLYHDYHFVFHINVCFEDLLISSLYSCSSIF